MRARTSCGASGPPLLVTSINVEVLVDEFCSGKTEAFIERVRSVSERPGLCSQRRAIPESGEPYRAAVASAARSASARMRVIRVFDKLLTPKDPTRAHASRNVY